MSDNYNVFQVDSLTRLRSSGRGLLLCSRYVALWPNGIQHDFSITRLDDGVYSLVHFNDALQKDKHYSSFRRAYNGLLAITRRIDQSMEEA